MENILVYRHQHRLTLNYSPVNKIYPEKSPSNYNELNETLKKNSIGLKSINENEKYIRISVNQTVSPISMK